MFRKTQQNQSGMALVLTLTILFSIMFSVLIVSSIIAGEVRSSNSMMQSIVSYYAAESGIEKGLYYLKEARESNDFSFFANAAPAGLDGYTTTTSNGASFEIATSSTAAPDYTARDVATSTPVYVDIIEPPGNVSAIDWGSPGVDAYQLDWGILNCFPYYSASRLQVTVNSFESDFSNPQSETHLAVCNCSFGSDSCDTYTGSVASNKYYRFTFKPLDIKVKQIDFSINNSGNGIPSESIIETYGTYKSSKYYMKAQLPAFSSTYDIFQYIIFSEQNLSK